GLSAPRGRRRAHPGTILAIVIGDGVAKSVLDEKPALGHSLGRNAGLARIWVADDFRQTLGRQRQVHQVGRPGVDQLMSKLCTARRRHDVIAGLHGMVSCAQPQYPIATDDEEMLLISVMMMQWKRRLSWWDRRDIGADIPVAEALGERGESGLEHVTVGDRAAFGVGNVEDRVHRALLSAARTVLYRYAWLT